MVDADGVVSGSLIVPYRIIDYWVFEPRKSGSMRGAASQPDARTQIDSHEARGISGGNPLSAEYGGKEWVLGYAFSVPL